MNQCQSKNYPLYPIPNINSFQELLDYAIENYPENIAFLTRSNKYTFAQFHHDVLCAAPFFEQYDRHFFLINITDKYYFSVIYFSIILSGNIAVLACENDLVYLSLPADTTAISDTMLSSIFSDPHPFTKSPLPTLFSCLVCSSGTTSKKKGVMLSQSNLLSDALGGMQVYEYVSNSRYVSILPFTHLFGIVADLLGSLLSGGTLCYGQNTLQFFDDLRYFNPDALNLPPVLVETLYKLLLNSNEKKCIVGENLKKIMCAGAKIDDSCNELFQQYGFTVYPAYGLTECSPCVCINRDNYYKSGSAGFILPCCNVRIIHGEIAVSGSNVMLGYYDAPNATRQVMQDNWLLTGDLGYIDEDNYLYIIGRKNNLIVFPSGKKALVEEIEGALNSIPNVVESLVHVSSCNDFRLDIVIVCKQAGIADKTKSQVYAALRSFCSKSFINSITIQLQPLSRNALGKIIRAKQ